MGDSQNEDLWVCFDSRLKLKFYGSQVTTDAGLLAYRELDEALGLTEMGGDVLSDSRQGRNKQYQLVPLLRQSIYSRLAGYEDVNDAEWLCVAPALRHVVGGRATLPEKQAVSSSEVDRFETQILNTQRNLTALMKLSGRWINNVHWRLPLKELILDLDSSVSETYGRQQGTAYNGHFACFCYHPLFLFNQHGDLEYAMRRSPFQRYIVCWRKQTIVTPFASKPTPYWSGKSRICSPVRSDGLPTSPRSVITASNIKRNHGSDRVAWWPKLSGTQANCSRVLDSS